MFLILKVNGVPNFLKNTPNGLIITNEEINRYESLEDLLQKKLVVKYNIDQSYEVLVKLLVSSVHCAEQSASLTLTPPLDVVEESKKKLFGSNAPDIGIGEPDATKPSSSWPTFSSLKGQPAGSYNSILFWNKKQAEFLFKDYQKSIVYGDFGSGKGSYFY